MHYANLLQTYVGQKGSTVRLELELDKDFFNVPDNFCSSI